MARSEPLCFPFTDPEFEFAPCLPVGLSRTFPNRRTCRTAPCWTRLCTTRCATRLWTLSSGTPCTLRCGAWSTEQEALRTTWRNQRKASARWEEYHFQQRSHPPRVHKYLWVRVVFSSRLVVVGYFFLLSKSFATSVSMLMMSASGKTVDAYERHYLGKSANMA